MKNTVQKYIQLGYKPVPLTKNTKQPFIKGYLDLHPSNLWLHYDCNVGLQSGINNLICFDADDPTTYEYLKVIFAPYHPWIVKTRNGWHFWVKTNEQYEWDKNFRVMGGKYKGEIRLQNCQTVVPPSTVDNYVYSTISGSIETVPSLPLPFIEFCIDALCNTDRLPLKGKPPKTTVEQIALERPDIRINHLAIKMPHIKWTKVKNLVKKVNWLRTALPNEPLALSGRYYPSRSEVLQSIIYTLVRYGYSEAQIRTICNNEGILYADQPTYQFFLCYDKAISKMISDPNRVQLQELYYLDHPWVHVNDKVTYQYLLARAMQFDIFTVKVYKADVMTFTGIKKHLSVTRSLDRLVGLGLIKVDGNLVEIVQTLQVSTEQGDNFVQQKGVSTRVCVYLPPLLTQNFDVEDDELQIDLITQKVLQKSIKTFNVFFGEKDGLTASEIITISQQVRKTVYNHLKKLLKLELIEKEGKTYTLHPDWQINLYELASDHFNQNVLALQAQKAKWLKIKRQQRMYGLLKEWLGADEALMLIKRYEQTGYIDDNIELALKYTKGAKG